MWPHTNLNPYWPAPGNLGIVYCREKPFHQDGRQSGAGNKELETTKISASPGYEFNKKNSVTAVSGKKKIKFDILQQGFAWIADNKIEKKMIKVMKKGSRLMITGYNQKGSQTIDHYSLLGFTKAYNAAKSACS